MTIHFGSFDERSCYQRESEDDSNLRETRQFSPDAEKVTCELCKRNAANQELLEEFADASEGLLSSLDAGKLNPQQRLSYVELNNAMQDWHDLSEESEGDAA